MRVGVCTFEARRLRSTSKPDISGRLEHISAELNLGFSILLE